MRTAIVLFTRDLRVHDHPALAAAVAAADHVVPLFVLDRAVLARFGAPNRVAFLLDALGDLGASLRARGGALAVREGDVVEETMRVAREARAEAIFLSEDVSAYAQARERRLRAACDEAGLTLHALPGVTVIPPGDLAPDGGECYRVFTPYWRRWRLAPRRAVVAAPRASRSRRASRAASSRRSRASCAAARRRRSCAAASRKAAAGSRAGSPAVSPTTSACTTTSQPTAPRGSARTCTSAASRRSSSSSARARRAGGEPFVRQLCWRDFYAQLLAARPEISHADFRSRDDRWRDDAPALAAWKAGRTGYPVIDAGMRQLAREGFMHNRARLLTGSFLTRDLYLDWRLGAAHFASLLTDGDVSNNSGNWQWVAGTGVDTRPNRVFNPTTQAKRFDPDGDVRAPLRARARGRRGRRRARAVEARPAAARATPSRSSTTPKRWRGCASSRAYSGT